MPRSATKRLKDCLLFSRGFGGLPRLSGRLAWRECARSNFEGFRSRVSARREVMRPWYVRTTEETNISANVLLKGRGLVECPRWHQGGLWFADWASSEIRVLEEANQSRTVIPAKAPAAVIRFQPGE